MLMLLAMLMLILLQVVGRYVFQNPPPWTEEAARFCMIWCGLLGAGSALFHRADPKLTKGVTSSKALPALLLRAVRWLAISVFVFPWLIYGPGFVFRHYFRATEAMKLEQRGNRRDCPGGGFDPARLRVRADGRVGRTLPGRGPRCMRLFVSGVVQETNVFSPIPTGWDSFFQSVLGSPNTSPSRRRT